MIGDQELNTWREQWSSVAQPLPDMRRIQQQIRLQQMRFVVENVLAVTVFIGGLIFALYVNRKEAEFSGSAWAAGVCVLMVVIFALRLWAQRGTWRAESQSTRAFVELWQKRLTAKIHFLRMTKWVVPCWLTFGAVMTARNWKTMSPEFKAHPGQALVLLIGSLLLLPVTWYWRSWLERRKQSELNEAKRVLDEMARIE
jgi:hypothetical protein